MAKSIKAKRISFNRIQYFPEYVKYNNNWVVLTFTSYWYSHNFVGNLK